MTAEEISRVAEYAAQLADAAYPKTGISDVATRASYQALEAFLRSLTQPQIEALCAVMWIGRGDVFGLDPSKLSLVYDAALEHAAKCVDERTPVYMADNGNLADWLQSGLKMLLYFQRC